jgi:hypothetical protein
MRSPNILCDAVAFGYGPIGKLLTVRNHLPMHYKFTLLATHGSYELGRLSSSDRIILCDTEEAKELDKVRAEFRATDLFINIMNPVSADYAHSLRVPMVHIDSLFWMWDNLPTSLAEADLYFIQNFVGVDTQLTKLAVSSPVVVGAIVDYRYKNNLKKKQLLVNFGGIRSKLIQPGINSSYTIILSKILEETLRQHQFERILFTGDSETMSLFAQSLSIPRCYFGVLPHDEFLMELSQSTLLITSPGLTTCYEAFTYSVPVVFLPPQNFSQFLILKRLRAEDAAPYSFHWLDFIPEMDMEVGIPEHIGVERVLSCIKLFEKDRDAQYLLKQTLRQAINLGGSDLNTLVELQGGLINKYGFNGAKDIANQIENIFK